MSRSAEWTKIIPGFLNEKSCLKLVSGTLIRAVWRWHRVRVTEPQKAQMDQLHQDLGQTPPLDRQVGKVA